MMKVCRTEHLTSKTNRELPLIFMLNAAYIGIFLMHQISFETLSIAFFNKANSPTMRPQYCVSLLS